MIEGKKPLNPFILFLILLGVYMLIAMPFKVMEVIPGFTDTRPVLLFQPVYGVFFGFSGCFAFAIGNLIADILSNSLRISSIAGLAANFIAPLIHYIFWTRISKTDYSLRNGRNILKHLALIGICSVVVVAIITPAVAAAYPEVDHMLFARSVFFNQIVFPIALGIPLSILMQEELGFKPFGRIRKNLS